jgi:hypothetical protein
MKAINVLFCVALSTAIMVLFTVGLLDWFSGAASRGYRLTAHASWVSAWGANSSSVFLDEAAQPCGPRSPVRGGASLNPKGLSTQP